MNDDKAKIVEQYLGDWESDWDASGVNEEYDPHTYILGLDPGQTTGIAIVRIDPRDQKKLPELVFLDQVEGGRYGFKEYFKPYYLSDNVILVSEKWKERNVKGADREPQYIEGSMHMLWDDENINYQYPEVKSLVPDEWLAEQNLWTPGKRHQMDALIHVIAFLRNQEHEGTMQALGGNGTIAEEGEAEAAQGTGEPGAQDGVQHSLADLADGEYEAESREATPQQGVESDHEDNMPGDITLVGKHEEDKKNRKERSLNDGFIGFDSPELSGGGRVVNLLDD